MASADRSGWAKKLRKRREPIAVCVYCTVSSRLYCTEPSCRFSVIYKLRRDALSKITYWLSEYTERFATCGKTPSEREKAEVRST